MPSPSQALVSSRQPVVHDCTGIPGYPVAMVAMNDEYRELLVHHWRKDVCVGDLMIVGRNILTRRTYRVTRNERNPDIHNLHRLSDGWMAVLRLMPPGPVTIGGRTYP